MRAHALLRQVPVATSVRDHGDALKRSPQSTREALPGGFCLYDPGVGLGEPPGPIQISPDIIDPTAGKQAAIRRERGMRHPGIRTAHDMEAAEWHVSRAGKREHAIGAYLGFECRELAASRAAVAGQLVEDDRFTGQGGAELLELAGDAARQRKDPIDSVLMRELASQRRWTFAAPPLCEAWWC